MMSVTAVRFSQISRTMTVPMLSLIHILVTGKMDAPAGSMILGSPAKVVRPLTPEELQSIQESAQDYLHMARQYRKG